MSATKQDITDILTAGREAAEALDPPSDGGTCNMDSAMVRIPRIHGTTVEAAAEAAGVHVSKWNSLAGPVWSVSADCETGQGARRTAYAEAMAQAMEEKIHQLNREAYQWWAYTYYRMD